jgi:hypothetical protein
LEEEQPKLARHYKPTDSQVIAFLMTHATKLKSQFEVVEEPAPVESDQ